MANRKRSNPPEPLPPSNFRWFFGHIFGLLRKLGAKLIAWIAICYICKVMSDALIAYAGKQSLASLSFRLAANVRAVWTVSIACSGISIYLYLYERRAHIKTRKTLAARNVE